MAFLRPRMKSAKSLAVDYNRTTIVDRLKAILEPSANRVLVFAEQERDFLHRIAAMDFHQPEIGVTLP